MRLGYALNSVTSNDLDLQIAALENAACDEIVIESSHSIEVIDCLLNRVKAGDCVVVWRLDKFAGRVQDLNIRVSYLKSMGVEFISLQEHIDTRAPNTALLLQLFAAMADFEKNTYDNRPRSPGRKPIVSPEKLQQALILIKGPQKLSVTAAANAVGVSRASLYRAIKR